MLTVTMLGLELVHENCAKCVVCFLETHEMAYGLGLVGNDVFSGNFFVT